MKNDVSVAGIPNMKHEVSRASRLPRNPAFSAPPASKKSPMTLVIDLRLKALNKPTHKPKQKSRHREKLVLNRRKW